MKKAVKMLVFLFAFAGAVQAPRGDGSSKAPRQEKPKTPGCLSGLFGRKKTVAQSRRTSVIYPAESASDTDARRVGGASAHDTDPLPDARAAIADAQKLNRALRKENRERERQIRQDMKDLEVKQARVGAALGRDLRRRTPSQEAAEQADLERELAAL